MQTLWYKTESQEKAGDGTITVPEVSVRSSKDILSLKKLESNGILTRISKIT